MDIYTLDDGFQKKSVVDVFESVIWTERYTRSGDINLVVPASLATINQLSEGTFLSTPTSKEIMLVETQSIKKGMLTVTGKTLLEFLNERVIRTTRAHEQRNWNISGLTPGFTLRFIVHEMVINGNSMNEIGVVPGIGGALNKIPRLELGEIDNTGAPIEVAVPFGPLYDALKTIAETYVLGMSLYLDYANLQNYGFLFKVYKGLDRTSSQNVRPLVRFSSALDTLTKISELRSITGYKTVAYAYAPALPGGLIATPGEAYADVSATGFDRRVLMIMAEDLTTDTFVGAVTVLNNILVQRAKDGLANNNYTKIVDGEVVPQSEFQYGTHYGLGDIIELQGQSGLVQKARITEYIRSQDATGEREYPTVSIID